MNADREPNRLPLRAGAMLLLSIAVVCIGLAWHEIATSGDDPEKALDKAGASSPLTSSSTAAPSTANAASSVKLCVYNAGSTAGLAREVADELTKKGFTVDSPSNLKSAKFTENTVFYDTDGDAGNTKSEAEKVAKAVPSGASVEPRPSSFAECASGIPVIMYSR